MLRRDPFVLENYPHLIASDEEIEVFLEAVQDDNIDLRLVAYGYDYDERAWMEATAVRMLWQAKQEKPADMDDLIDKAIQYTRTNIQTRLEWEID